jgi:hypothetical protein
VLWRSFADLLQKYVEDMKADFGEDIALQEGKLTFAFNQQQNNISCGLRETFAALLTLISLNLMPSVEPGLYHFDPAIVARHGALPLVYARRKQDNGFEESVRFRLRGFRPRWRLASLPGPFLSLLHYPQAACVMPSVNEGKLNKFSVALRNPLAHIIKHAQNIYRARVAGVLR